MRNHCFDQFGASEDMSGPFGLFGRSDLIGGSEGVTWEQSKSHHFANTADTARERSHRHKSMPHVSPIRISKPELWILCSRSGPGTARRVAKNVSCNRPVQSSRNLKR